MDKSKCSSCAGRGYIQWHNHWDGGNDPCEVCGGTGSACMDDLCTDSHTDEFSWVFWGQNTENYMPPISRKMIPDERTAKYVANLIRQAEVRGEERGAELGKMELSSQLRRLIGAERAA